MNRLLLFLVILVSISCTQNKRIVEAKTKEEIKRSQIIFLTYQLTKTKESRKAILIDKIVVEGKLKKPHPNHNLDFLVCKQLDEHSVLLDSVVVDNPLKRSVEYADESGNLQKQIIELDSAEVVVRMQLHPETKFFVLEEQTNSLLTLTTNEL